MKRNFGLDIVRACAIMMALAYHSGFHANGLDVGGIGVEFFFVLSGFLIGGILFNLLDENLPLSETLKKFWISRWFRILPLYYVMLLLKFVILDHKIGYNIFYYVFFLQNNFYGINFFPISWSLVVEEWFYMSIPFFLFYLIRYRFTKPQIFSFFTLVVVGVFILRGLYIYYTNAPRGGINGNIVLRYDALLFGVILSYLKHHQNDWFQKLQQFWVFALGTLIFIAYQIFYYVEVYPVNLINQHYFIRWVGFTLLPFTMALMMPYISLWETYQPKNWFGKAFFWFFTTTSLIAYALYLTHIFIYEVFIRLLHMEHGFLTIILANLSTYGISYVVYFYLEKPFLQLRKRFV